MNLDAGRMKVSVFTTMPQGIYSGGRYLSLMLAYAMSRAGAEVNYITNNAPLFERDFEPFQRMCPIRSIVAPTFTLPDDLTSDWVVVIPTGGFNNRFYSAAIDHARAQNARLALLSFETPNWYASLSPFPRSPMPTESWRQVVEGGGLVVTIAREGVEPARAYFGPGSQRAPRRFGYWHPAINDLAAEAALAMVGERPRRSITMFVRTEDPHKGAQDLLRLDPRVLDGHVLSLVFGRGVDEGYVAALRRHFAPARDFAIEILSQITDVEKFALLARTRLLLFPSWFEGYGYPPVEAAWMGVPSVAWDLPLLQEVAGPAITTVPRGDIRAFEAAIRHVLETQPPGPEIRSMMAVQPDTLTSGQAMLSLLQGAAPMLAPAAAPGPALSVAGGGVGMDPRTEQLASHHAGAVQLYETETRLQAGRVSFSARIDGARKGDQLVIRLPHGTMPVIPLDGSGQEGGRRILCEGQLDRWPMLADRLRLRLSLQRADRSSVSLGTVDLAPDWAALLSPSAEGGLRRAEDHLVLADPAQIADSPLLAALLCEFCETLRQTGRRSALIAPRHRPEPDDTLVPDLLPQFDSVTEAGATQTRAIVTEVLAAGGIVAATRARAIAADLEPEAGLVIHPGGRPRDALILFLPKGAAADLTGAMDHSPDARRWGRRGRAAALAPLVVFLPHAPLDPQDETAQRYLKRLELALPAARPVIPEALCADGVPVMAGVNLRLEPMTPSDLAARLSEGGRVVGLRLAGEAEAESDGSIEGDADGEAPASGETHSRHRRPDPATAAAAALLAAYRVPVVRAPRNAGAMDSVLAEILEHLAESDRTTGGLAAILASALPPAQDSGALTMPIGRIEPPSSPPPVLRPPVPVIAHGDVLGFSTTLGEEAPALAAGWSDRTILGARIARDQGVVVFRLAPGDVLPTRLELMVHLSPAADPGISVKVLLNGNLVGSLSRLPAGASVHGLPIREEAWVKDAEQVLILRLVRSEGANAASKITLVAVSPGAAPTPAVRPPAALPGRMTGRQAPLYTAPLHETVGLVACRLTKGAPTGFLRLTAGWSAPEAEFTWSVGSLAVVMFDPPLAATVPILLTLKGSTLALPRTDGRPAGQRMILRHGSEVLAQAWLDAKDTPPVQVVLPAGGDFDTLFLDLPDAISPAASGAGPDSRSLGMALREAEARVLPVRLDAAPIGPDPDAGWPVRGARVTAAPGFLRLLGTGPVPESLRFGLAGSRMAMQPLKRPGGWEVGLPLSPAVLTAGHAEILCLSDTGAGPLPDGLLIEIWTDPEHRRAELPLDAEGQSAQLSVILTEVPDDSGEAVPMTLPAATGGVPADPPALRTTPPGQRLPLPASFAFHEGSPALAQLAGGWSHPEAEWVWTSGPHARLTLPAPAGALLIGIEASALVFDSQPHQRARLAAGGRVFATLVFATRTPERVMLILPPGAAPWETLHLYLPDAVIPAAVGLIPDTRQLALRLQRMDLAALPDDLLRDDGVRLPATVVEPRILRQTVLDDGSRAIVLAGPSETAPFGLAVARLADVAVIAHAMPVPGGWHAHLLLTPDDLDEEGRTLLHVYATEADLDAGMPTDLLALPVISTEELAAAVEAALVAALEGIPEDQAEG